MKHDVIAKRYANALIQIATEKQAIDDFEKELQIIKEVFVHNQELMGFLENPNIELGEKKAMIEKAFSSFSQEILNMMFLLIDRKREEVMIEIVDMYVELANQVRNIADATVYSVRLLTDEEKRAVTETFAKLCGKGTIRIHNVVDDELLGGIKVRIGNRIFDGSLQGKIARIRRELIAEKA